MEKRINSVSTSLKTAFSYIEEVEKQLEDFNRKVQSESQSTDDAIEAGFWRGAGAVLKGRWAIGKEKGKLMGDLDLAENEIKTAEQKNPDAQLETGGGTFSIPFMKAIVYQLRGKICAIAGELKNAEANLKTSLNHLELPDTYYGLALALEDLKQPIRACETYQKCIDTANNISQKLNGDLAEDAEKLAIQARKDLQRLESRKIGSGWFVGSWKVFLGLVGFTVISFFMLFDKNAAAGGVGGIFIFGGLAGGYWWWKWR